MIDFDGQRARTARLARRYGAFFAALVGFVLVLALLERAGASRAAAVLPFWEPRSWPTPASAS